MLSQYILRTIYTRYPAKCSIMLLFLFLATLCPVRCNVKWTSLVVPSTAQKRPHTECHTLGLEMRRWQPNRYSARAEDTTQTTERRNTYPISRAHALDVGVWLRLSRHRMPRRIVQRIAVRKTGTKRLNNQNFCCCSVAVCSMHVIF